MDLWNRQYKAIIKVIEELPTEEFVSLFNQYMTKEICDNAMMPMREIDLLLEDMPLRDILRAIDYTQFDTDDEYYYWNNLNYICSWDGLKTHRPIEFDEEIAEYCVDFEKDLGIPEIAKILAWREEEE